MDLGSSRVGQNMADFFGPGDLEDDVDDDVEAGGDDEGDGEDGLVAPPHLEDQGDQIRKII